MWSNHKRNARISMDWIFFLPHKSNDFPPAAHIHIYIFVFEKNEFVAIGFRIYIGTVYSTQIPTSIIIIIININRHISIYGLAISLRRRLRTAACTLFDLRGLNRIFYACCALLISTAFLVWFLFAHTNTSYLTLARVCIRRIRKKRRST